jgi:uncharacterized repeat protein (TIGR02543 family)
VESIGLFAFYACRGFSRVTIPDSVSSIGQNAFRECSGFTGELTIPMGMTIIDHNVFYGCSSLSGVTIPGGITSIGSGAFEACSSLSSFTILNGMTSINNKSFIGCSSLSSFTIPDSVKTINVDAFEGCSVLMVINCHYGSNANAYAKAKSIQRNNFYDAVISGVSDKEYTGSSVTQPSMVVEAKTFANPEGITITEDVDYTISYSGNIDEGTATVTITGKGNYAGTVSRSFAIGSTPGSTPSLTPDPTPSPTPDPTSAPTPVPTPTYIPNSDITNMLNNKFFVDFGLYVIGTSTYTTSENSGTPSSYWTNIQSIPQQTTESRTITAKRWEVANGDTTLYKPLKWLSNIDSQIYQGISTNGIYAGSRITVEEQINSWMGGVYKLGGTGSQASPYLLCAAPISANFPPDTTHLYVPPDEVGLVLADSFFTFILKYDKDTVIIPGMARTGYLEKNYRDITTTSAYMVDASYEYYPIYSVSSHTSNEGTPGIYYINSSVNKVYAFILADGNSSRYSWSSVGSLNWVKGAYLIMGSGSFEDPYVLVVANEVPTPTIAPTPDPTPTPTPSYDVTFNADGGVPAPDPQSVVESGLVSKPVSPIKVGMTFAGWFANNTFLTLWNFASDVVTEAMTLYAKWVEEITVAPIANQEYTGKAVKPDVEVKQGLSTLTEVTDYTITYSNNLSVGTATATVHFTGAYEGVEPMSVNFEIVSQLPTPEPTLNVTPTLPTYDTDGDLFPDVWEDFYIYDKTNPNDPVKNGDDDEDGYTNWQEYLNGTNPKDPNDPLPPPLPGPSGAPPLPVDPTDTDGDGFRDEWEDFYGYNKSNSSDPARGDDDDGDGYTNWKEYLHGTDPKNPDTDGDGFTDGWEVDNGYNPLDSSDPAPSGDEDDDGLTNHEESLLGTDPTNHDTDGDGFSDKWEVDNGFNPLDSSDPAPSDDADSDGLTNQEEYALGTNPKNADTDGDGVSDGDEVHGSPATNPLNPDTDGDGYTDGQERDAGTNPLNPSDYPGSNSGGGGSGGGGGGGKTDDATLIVRCVTEDGKVVYSDSATANEGSQQTVSAPTLEDYVLADGQELTKTVTIKAGQTIVEFVYTAHRVTPAEKPLLETDLHIKYVNGYENGEFKADNNINRAEVSAMFFRLLKDAEKNANIASVFSDITGGEWYEQPVKYLAKIGILQGYKDGTFMPEQNITRAEFTAIAARFLEPDENYGDTFTDVPDDHWAYDYIATASSKGWIEGYPGGKFEPENDITRAEVVTIINRMLERKVAEEDVPQQYVSLFSDLSTDHWAFANIIEASVEHEYTRKDDGYEIWTDN